MEIVQCSTTYRQHHLQITCWPNRLHACPHVPSCACWFCLSPPDAFMKHRLSGERDGWRERERWRWGGGLLSLSPRFFSHVLWMMCISQATVCILLLILIKAPSCWIIKKRGKLKSRQKLQKGWSNYPLHQTSLITLYTERELPAGLTNHTMTKCTHSHAHLNGHIHTRIHKHRHRHTNSIPGRMLLFSQRGRRKVQWQNHIDTCLQGCFYMCTGAVWRCTCRATPLLVTPPNPENQTVTVTVVWKSLKQYDIYSNTEGLWSGSFWLMKY